MLNHLISAAADHELVLRTQCGSFWKAMCGLWRQYFELSIAGRDEDSDCTTLPQSDTYIRSVPISEECLFLNIMKQTGFEVTKFHLGVSALESEPAIGYMVDSKNMKMDIDGKLIGVD